MTKLYAEDLYTVAEFAKAIGVATITVKRWDKSEGRSTALRPKAFRRNRKGHRFYTNEQIQRYHAAISAS